MKLIWRRLEGQSGHAVGRELLAELYRAETGEPLPEICVAPQGKPYFPENEWHFSISHTQNHAFCALSRKNVGIDAEETDRNIDLRLRERVLSPSEQTRCRGREDLLRLWVQKEAWAKLTGRGLGDYLKNTDFDPNDPRIQIIDGCYVAVLEEDYAV